MQERQDAIQQDHLQESRILLSQAEDRKKRIEILNQEIKNAILPDLREQEDEEVEDCLDEMAKFKHIVLNTSMFAQNNNINQNSTTVKTRKLSPLEI